MTAALDTADDAASHLQPLVDFNVKALSSGDASKTQDVEKNLDVIIHVVADWEARGDGDNLRICLDCLALCCLVYDKIPPKQGARYWEKLSYGTKLEDILLFCGDVPGVRHYLETGFKRVIDAVHEKVSGSEFPLRIRSSALRTPGTHDPFEASQLKLLEKCSEPEFIHGDLSAPRDLRQLALLSANVKLRTSAARTKHDAQESIAYFEGGIRAAKRRFKPPPVAHKPGRRHFATTSKRGVSVDYYEEPTKKSKRVHDSVSRMASGLTIKQEPINMDQNEVIESFRKTFKPYFFGVKDQALARRMRKNQLDQNRAIKYVLARTGLIAFDQANIEKTIDDVSNGGIKINNRRSLDKIIKRNEPAGKKPRGKYFLLLDHVGSDLHDWFADHPEERRVVQSSFKNSSQCYAARAMANEIYEHIKTYYTKNVGTWDFSHDAGSSADMVSARADPLLIEKANHVMQEKLAGPQPDLTKHFTEGISTFWKNHDGDDGGSTDADSATEADSDSDSDSDTDGGEAGGYLEDEALATAMFPSKQVTHHSAADAAATEGEDDGSFGKGETRKFADSIVNNFIDYSKNVSTDAKVGSSLSPPKKRSEQEDTSDTGDFFLGVDYGTNDDDDNDPSIANLFTVDEEEEDQDSDAEIEKKIEEISADMQRQGILQNDEEIEKMSKEEEDEILARVNQLLISNNHEAIL